MGDMKTPDFDDLLAAFDIPDIETIESSPEEENSDTEGAPGGKDKTTYPTDQSDVPAVSVIVKNTVRTDIPGTEKEKRVHNDFKTQNDSTEGDSQAADPELCNIEGLSKVSNGLKGTDSNTLSNIEPVPQQLTGPLSTTFEHENKTNDTTVPLQPSQDAKDCIKPLFNTKLSAIGSISPVLSPSQVNNLNPNTPSPYNIKTQLNNFNQSDEEDSDPDLEGALVIQESPESAESAVPPKRPKLKHKPDVNLYLSDSTEKNSNSIHTSPASLLDNSDLKNEAKTVTPSSQAAPLPCPPPLVKDEKYPEHVIDERDSPESPPPSETGMLVPKRSPELPQTDTECTEQRPKECEASKEDTAETTAEMNSETEEKLISTVTDPPSLGPVKVKMKRSARAVSAKKGGRTKTEAVKTIKAESDTRPRRKSLKQSKEEKATAGKGAKIKLSSAPEISLKTTAKVTAAGITLRSLGQKTLPGGVTLPLPSLLPPLSGSSRPASIVNSTGAIISKSQTNLVEAFNRILNNKNLLPSYKPDLASSRQAEWGLSLPAQGYRCLECGDSFALEQSLARHYDRRSLRIEVTCNHCAKRLAFFNKCSLLLHAREHKERGLIMQCSHLVMKPVPVEQMIGPHEPAAAAVPPVLSNVNPNATSVRKTEEVQYGNHKCPECQTQFSGAEEVAKHFQELKSQTTTCTECSPPMLLSNSCCAAAHQRIHLNSAPHVCPECGGTSKPPTFKTHLEETCFHFARRIGYRCSSCLVVFGGINSVKSHIQQAHCDMFQKCPICPMAFKSAPSIQNHITAQHPTLTDTQAISIFKCVMCDTVFTNKNLLYVHFDTHLANQKVHVFKCPECPKQFSVRSSLMDHLKTHHTKVKQESPLLLSQSQPSVKMESSEGEEWSTPAKEVTPQKTRKHFPCTKCESSFSTTSNLRRHIRDKHKTVTRSFRCQFCTDMKKTFSSRAMLEKHIKLRHSLEAGDQDFLMEGGDEADSSSEQDGGSVFRRKRRAAIKSEQEEESVHEVRLAKKWRSSSALSSDPQIEKGFRCAPCGYTCEEQAEFLEHISQHRKGAGGSSQQCLQCGVCFTSNHSLSRHRFIVHRVRDQESQEITNTCPAPSPNENHDDNKCVFSAPESPALSQGKDGEGALACKVCGKHFEKATDLNTHFRTHGMAFINARNTAKTT